jgi:hypothetical protein
MKTRNVCPVCHENLELVETPDGLRFLCETEDCCVGRFTREAVPDSLEGNASRSPRVKPAIHHFPQVTETDWVPALTA